jgi:tRNA(Leu) C34 or U34 (ribose-2'-O)-methylase TrmL
MLHRPGKSQLTGRVFRLVLSPGSSGHWIRPLAFF